MEQNHAKTSGSLPAWKWTGADTLDLVHEVNERSLQMLGKRKRLSRRGQAVGARDASDMKTVSPDLWRGLDESARHRAARCPFLLVELRFQDEAWWSEVRRDGTGRLDSSTGSSYFPPKPARELTGETLMLAWLTARSDRRTATLLLGLTPGVAGVLASLRPGDVRRIAARHSRELRPRWPNNARFWRQLLVAARRGDEESLMDIHLHGLQLLGSDLLPGRR